MEDKKKIQQPIDYADVIDLGFERQNDHDSVFFDRYGFDYFLCTKELTSHIYIDWDVVTRTCTLIRHDEDLNILAQMPLRNNEEVIQMVNFFKD